MIVLLSTVAVALLLNIWATLYLSRVSGLTRHQRTIQVAIIWLFPIVGAVIVYSVNRELERQAAPASTFPKSQISDQEVINQALARSGSSDSFSSSHHD